MNKKRNLARSLPAKSNVHILFRPGLRQGGASVRVASSPHGQTPARPLVTFNSHLCENQNYILKNKNGSTVFVFSNYIKQGVLNISAQLDGLAQFLLYYKVG